MADDPRSLTSTSDGMRAAWSLVERTWQSTVERAGRLPEERLHEAVDGEWSFVETLRHLVFVTDAWVRRPILGEARAYHRLGLPPDHRVGEPEPGVDVAPWGIDVHAVAPLEEVLATRTDRMHAVREVVDGLGAADLQRVCAPNPAPGFPPVAALQVGFCLSVVVGEEWEHHGFATRDLAVLEAR
jgi:hypothetical protein